VVESHQSVDWYQYFKSIRVECPWSYRAYLDGEIDIRDYSGEVLPLGRYQARVYIVHAPTETVEALAAALDHGEDEWLFSYPGYGEFATPRSVIIQQNRQRLSELRAKLKNDPPESAEN
jgi:hypothetical protein